MRTIELTSGSLNLEDALDLASHDNIILKATDGREFVLAEMDNFDREIELTRKDQELMNLLDQRSKERGVLTIRQARQQLGLL
ncbi:hypothetical protein [Candidatus Thiosymbion oneisti]|uniref:hypothetical protein n=1 Tax=Candidatus Thiosymbion oneisti TaxID=589554 RepID=UPI00105DA4E6|nr:hypothetical protein [Candidatus Thiosymbion oneisti]